MPTPKEDVPSAVEAKEFDFRVVILLAQWMALPHLITFKSAELTEKAVKCWKRWMPTLKSLKEGPSVPIATRDMPFLEGYDQERS